MFTVESINGRGVINFGDGVYAMACTRCGGRGVLREYGNVFGGECFKCHKWGVNSNKRFTLEEITKHTAKLEAQSLKRIEGKEREAAMAQAEAAAWRERNSELCSRIFAAEDFGGILAEFAAQIGYKALTPKQIAFAEVLLTEHEEMMTKRAAKSYIGEVGKRQVFEGEVTFVTRIEGYYGASYLVKIDVDGNDVVTIGTSEFCYSAEKGQKVQFKATVKEHSEYDGVPQTKVTRCVSL